MKQIINKDYLKDQVKHLENQLMQLNNQRAVVEQSIDKIIATKTAIDFYLLANQ